MIVTYVLFHRMLTETVGSLYVGGYDRPFSTIDVKVSCELHAVCNLVSDVKYLAKQIILQYEPI